MSYRHCLYCEGPLGLRRFTGTLYCSDAHAEADRNQRNALILERLRYSAARFRTALEIKAVPRPLRKAS